MLNDSRRQHWYARRRKTQYDTSEKKKENERKKNLWVSLRCTVAASYFILYPNLFEYHSLSARALSLSPFRSFHNFFTCITTQIYASACCKAYCWVLLAQPILIEREVRFILKLLSFVKSWVYSCFLAITMCRVEKFANKAASNPIATATTTTPE